jgi:hypothetical protein
MVSNYGQFGLPASAEISKKYPDATAIGFMAGKRTKLTILDVDTTNERVLADAQDRHGPSPVIVKSASGKFHAYYRHNGEGRHIRPWPDKPIDLLGGGFVVAPPSRGISGDYQFIQGNLDDLDRLPVIRNVEIASPPISPDLLPGQSAVDGKRNNTLWRYCMKSAHSCDDIEALLDVARTRNEGYMPTLDDEEVVKIARSAWGYTERGENRIGIGRYVHTDHRLIDNLMMNDPDAFQLLMFLQRHHWGRDFTLANETGRLLPLSGSKRGQVGWDRERFAGARQRLVEYGHLIVVQPASFKLNRPMTCRLSSGGIPVYSAGVSAVNRNKHPSPLSSPPDDDGYSQWLKRMNRIFQ